MLMLAVLRRRDFGLLWTASLISTIGDWVLLGALPFYVYQMTGSALASGGTFMAEVLPMLLFGSVAGVFADRWNRKRTLVAADLIRAGLVALLVFVRSPEWIPLIYVVGFLMSTVGQFASTSFSAFMPRLVDPDQLGPANSAFSITNNLGRMIGPGVGGILMASVGLGAVVLADAISFLISGLLVYLIATSAIPEAVQAAEGSALARVGREWLGGLRIVVGARWIAVLLTAMGIATFGDSILTVLIAPFVSQVLGGDASLFGLVLTLRGLGGLVGGLMIGEISRHLAPQRLIGFSAIALGVILLAVVVLASVPATLALIVVAGPAVIGFYVGAYTMLQGGVSDQFRGRVFGVYATVNALTLLLGMTLAGTLGDLVGIVSMLAVGALLYMLAGATALGFLRPAPAPAVEVAAD
jgi:predicted MFS family arabinose efflux permease